MSAATIRIEGELSIYRAVELQEVLQAALQAAIGAGHDLTVDLSGVSEFDSAGVQLLIAARRSAEAAERALCLVDPSPAVCGVLELLGLVEHFGGPARPH